MGGRIGNVGVDLAQTAACGYEDTTYRVFCLDQDGRLDAAGQLALIAWASAPITVRVSSRSTADMVGRILSQRPERLAQARILEQDDVSCRGACARRITVARELRPAPQPPTSAPPMPGRVSERGS